MTNLSTVTSADGTTIAYELHGEGPPLVVVGGALCARARLRDTALALAEHAAVVNYDRRGRGESGDALGLGARQAAGEAATAAVAREVEDLAALVAAVTPGGAPVAMYGHSSGAALALRAAAAGVPVSRLVAHEPPFGPDTAEQRREAADYVADLDATLGEGRREDAVALFLRVTGVPAEAVDDMRGEPWFAAMAALAPSLAYDSEAMGNRTGGTVPLDVARRVAARTLVLVGGRSPDFMLESARSLVAALPAGSLRVLDGEEHVVPPERLAPVVGAFLAP
jgi:pimeloyl-ACP methyl ester carboxylesterase